MRPGHREGQQQVEKLLRVITAAASHSGPRHSESMEPSSPLQSQCGDDSHDIELATQAAFDDGLFPRLESVAMERRTENLSKSDIDPQYDKVEDFRNEACDKDMPIKKSTKLTGLRSLLPVAPKKELLFGAAVQVIQARGTSLSAEQSLCDQGQDIDTDRKGSSLGARSDSEHEADPGHSAAASHDSCRDIFNDVKVDPTHDTVQNDSPQRIEPQQVASSLNNKTATSTDVLQVVTNEESRVVVDNRAASPSLLSPDWSKVHYNNDHQFGIQMRCVVKQIPARYVRIPKEQQELLNSDDSWYSNPSGRGTSANLPGQVLARLQAFHQGQQKRRGFSNGNIPASSAEVVTPPNAPRQLNDVEVEPSQCIVNEAVFKDSTVSQSGIGVVGANGDDSDDDSQVSWSDSGHCATSDSQSERSSVAPEETRSSSGTGKKDHDCLSQFHVQADQRVQINTTTTMLHADSPSSSCEEDELEIEAPHHLEDAIMQTSTSQSAYDALRTSRPASQTRGMNGLTFLQVQRTPHAKLSQKANIAVVRTPHARRSCTGQPLSFEKSDPYIPATAGVIAKSQECAVVSQESTESPIAEVKSTQYPTGNSLEHPVETFYHSADTAPTASHETSIEVPRSSLQSLPHHSSSAFPYTDHDDHENRTDRIDHDEGPHSDALPSSQQSFADTEMHDLEDCASDRPKGNGFAIESDSKQTPSSQRSQSTTGSVEPLKRSLSLLAEPAMKSPPKRRRIIPNEDLSQGVQSELKVVDLAEEHRRSFLRNFDDLSTKQRVPQSQDGTFQSSIFTDDPVHIYKTAYPDYTGSLRSIIRVAVYIRRLRSRRTAPHSFLWDDFIRAFDSDYGPYVQKNRSANRRPLEYIQFYNEHVMEPKFLKGIVTAANIDKIFNMHPEDSQEFDRQLTVYSKDAATPSASYAATQSSQRDQREASPTTWAHSPLTKTSSRRNTFKEHTLEHAILTSPELKASMAASPPHRNPFFKTSSQATRKPPSENEPLQHSATNFEEDLELEEMAVTASAKSARTIPWIRSTPSPAQASKRPLSPMLGEPESSESRNVDACADTQPQGPPQDSHAIVQDGESSKIDSHHPQPLVSHATGQGTAILASPAIASQATRSDPPVFLPSNRERRHSHQSVATIPRGLSFEEFCVLAKRNGWKRSKKPNASLSLAVENRRRTMPGRIEP